MKKYKEYRRISMEKVRGLCIKYDFYTCGDWEEYDNLLTNVVGYRELTLKVAFEIATDIKKHSYTLFEIEEIAELLINNSYTRLIEF